MGKRGTSSGGKRRRSRSTSLVYFRFPTGQVKNDSVTPNWKALNVIFQLYQGFPIYRTKDQGLHALLGQESLYSLRTSVILELGLTIKPGRLRHVVFFGKRSADPERVFQTFARESLLMSQSM